VNDVLTNDMLAKTAEIPILSSDGTGHPFASIYAGQPTLIIFLRHFFCGMCKEYVREISQKIHPNEVAAQNKILIFIGCGQPSFIENYKNNMRVRKWKRD